MHERKRLKLIALVLTISVTHSYTNADTFLGLFSDVFFGVSTIMQQNIKNMFHTTVHVDTSSNLNETQSDKINRYTYDCFGMGYKVAKDYENWLKHNANSSKDIKVEFYIKTRYTSHRVKVTDSDWLHFNKTTFDISHRTFLIVHGFFASNTVDWVIDMENSLLKWNDVNVITVNWNDGNFPNNYFKVARSTQIVGNHIATFFDKLRRFAKESHISKENIGYLHFIGHSLGAHICGYTASAMKENNIDWIVHRITGLDPAKLCFQFSSKTLSLDSGDALFVDVIHTNAKDSIIHGLSLFNPIGHFDFYPNGGRHQPGCTGPNFLSSNYIGRLRLPRFLSEVYCNHRTAYLYFIESINDSISRNCTFWAKPWDLNVESAQKILWDSCNDQTCTEMGINSEAYFKGHREAFFVLTSNSAPFCRIKNFEEIKVIEKILKSRYK